MSVDELPNRVSGVAKRTLHTELDELAASLPVVAWGWTAARAWTATRDRIAVARQHELSSDMEFTYRNPARSTEPARVLRSARTVITVACEYGVEPTPAPSTRMGRIARYAATDAYGHLRTALGAIRTLIVEHGHRGVVVADDNALVDREAAWRAGIGWYGHNSMLLVPGIGSWVVLGSVITTAELGPCPKPPVKPSCGTCRRCQPACPTGAIGPDGSVDANKCVSWLLQSSRPIPVELRGAIGDRIYGCDDCQVVCPPNRTRERQRPRQAVTPAVSPEWIDLVELLRCDDGELMHRVGDWYVARRDPQIVRRNAVVVLANTADPYDAEVQSELIAAAGSSHEMLSEHARWAVERFEARKLLTQPGST